MSESDENRRFVGEAPRGQARAARLAKPKPYPKRSGGVSPVGRIDMCHFIWYYLTDNCYAKKTVPVMKINRKGFA